MEKYNVKFKKKFGQNFLKDVSTVKKIVDGADIKNKSLVIEVGPGGAILTRELSKTSDYVLAYEIDNDLEAELTKKLANYNNVEVLFKDFLEADIVQDINSYNYEHIYFVSNVPYYITTPIVMKLIDSGIKFDNIVMMVQKEVADRFSTAPGSKEYGSITVYLNYFFDISEILYVPREEFVPIPNVDSKVISLKPKNELLSINNFELFEKLIKDSFQFKRKNLRNNLRSYDLNLIEIILKKYNYDLTSRAEEISMEIFVEIANSIY